VTGVQHGMPEVPTSNVDKVMYPATGFTKGELIEYYRAIAPAMLPHLQGRPLTLKRYPNGVDGQAFFEKRCPPHRPAWVHTVPVGRAGSRPAYEACVADDVDTLVWLANLAAIELHPPLFVATDPERPTAMVFDLDPGAPAGVVECAVVACAIRDMLQDLALVSFPKTSGSKGLQLYVPLHPAATFDVIKAVAHTMAVLIEKEHKDLVLTSMSKSARAGRVFIDWSQNHRTKTTVSVYSLRARPRPSVSTPLHWSEVEDLSRFRSAIDPDRPLGPVDFDPAQVLERVGADGDLFAPVEELPQRLPDALIEAAASG
jgi:bifunctional non-homologous end joining protein LigD